MNWFFTMLFWCIECLIVMLTYYVLQYFIKTQKCKFGPRCKFNHPKEIVAPSVGTLSIVMWSLILYCYIYFNRKMSLFNICKTLIIYLTWFRVQRMLILHNYLRGHRNPHAQYEILKLFFLYARKYFLDETFVLSLLILTG